MSILEKVKVGLYGVNGHQIADRLVNHPRATAVAAAAMDDRHQRTLLERGVKIHETLDELLADDSVQMVSLCSPMRSEQADDAVRAMTAGKHVFAEKPAAMTESDLDRIIDVARQTGRIFHEQAGTAFDQPYSTLRQIVQRGDIGNVVQIFAQKSYPWHDLRPQDERLDGGLLMQVGIYNLRFVEHVAGASVKSVVVRQTASGNPVQGGQAAMAASWLMELENGGLATAVANYLCPGRDTWDKWGYETLRIWGDKGFVESIDSGRIGTLAVNGKPAAPLDFTQPTRDYLDTVLEEIQTGEGRIPFSLEQELSPTRWVIRSRAQVNGA